MPFDLFRTNFSERTGRRLSRRAVTKASAGVAVATLATGRLGRVFAAQEAASTPAASEIPTWDAIDQLFAAAAPESALLAAELIDGRCLPIHGLNAQDVLPVASSFKLWILGAVAVEIEAGRLAWDQPVAIEDRHRSVPGGDLRYALPGSSYTLRYLVERMIQKSDNTATDHVFYLVGREKIEAVLTTMGHSNPSLNVPIISTKELAFLEFAFTAEERDAFYARPVDERRRILDDDIAQRPIESLPDIDQDAPLELDRVEWFATREDLCETMNWLDLKTRETGLLPVAEVLALETQLEFVGEIWPYAGFKGGSELGVLNGTWLLHRADGRRFVYTVGFKNPTAGIDTDAAIVAMIAGRDRLAITP